MNHLVLLKYQPADPIESVAQFKFAEPDGLMRAATLSAIGAIVERRLNKTTLFLPLDLASWTHLEARS